MGTYKRSKMNKEEVPSDEEEEFKHVYRLNLKMKIGLIGTDIRYRLADPTEKAFNYDIVEEYHYKVRAVLPFLNSVQQARMGLSMENSQFQALMPRMITSNIKSLALSNTSQ